MAVTLWRNKWQKQNSDPGNKIRRTFLKIWYSAWQISNILGFLPFSWAFMTFKSSTRWSVFLFAFHKLLMCTQRIILSVCVSEGRWNTYGSSSESLIGLYLSHRLLSPSPSNMSFIQAAVNFKYRSALYVWMSVWRLVSCHGHYLSLIWW